MNFCDNMWKNLNVLCDCFVARKFFVCVKNKQLYALQIVR
jgi:hypothetical protein